jgi:hypothetical protein
MNHSGPLLTLLLTAGFVLAPARSTAATTDNPDEKKPPLAMVTLAEGDVRYSPNNRRLDASKPGEQIEEGMDLREGGVLATGDGRAEVDLQNEVKLFLAEDSELLIWRLRTHGHHLQSELALVIGTATLYGRVPEADSLIFGTAAHHLQVQDETSVRFDSYVDGTAITPLNAESYPDGLKLPAPFEPNHSLFYEVGETTPNYSVQLPARADWDHWVAWQARGTGANPLDCTSPLRKFNSACLQAASSRQLTGCSSFEIPQNNGCWCPGSLACPGRFNPPIFDIKMRNHHKPCTWVRVGKTVGYVPKDPKDRKGQPPANLKYGLLVPSKQPGKPPERIPIPPSEKVTVFSKPPREFRDGVLPEATRVGAPNIFARTHEEFITRALNADGTHANVGAGANAGKGGGGETWARSHGDGGKSSGGDRGSSSGANGRGSPGSSSKGSGGGHNGGSGGHSGGGGYSGGGSSGGGHSGGGSSGGGGGGGGHSGGGGGGSHGSR